MYRMRRAVVMATLIFLAVAAAAPQDNAIPTERLAPLLALIKPAKDEDKWARIPWHANLWEARQKAATQGKPILLWEMDGQPLGCT